MKREKKEEVKLALGDLLRWIKDEHPNRKDLIDDIEKSLKKG